jgi:hypothetical protein
MIEVFRDIDSVTVGFLQSKLESEGIATFMRNQALSSTEVTIPAFYPAICVLEAEDAPRAKALIKSALQSRETGGAATEEAAWICKSCGESNPANFEICWKCEVPLEKEG